jgi:2-desacetyl-2-hydroxyethyl bacteriochlorophyllide A dehydrogenase
MDELPRSMIGLWLEDRRLTLRDELPVPVPAPGEALVRVRVAGICSTDLELTRGYYPFRGVPGHEFVGDVVRAPGAEPLEGTRVVGEINAACGHCASCEAGQGGHCPQRTVLGIAGRDGAFAEYLRLPFANLHAVPPELDDEVAVFVEPLAAALVAQHAPGGPALGPGPQVVLLGAGRLGQLLARTLALAGCDLVVVARHARQRALLEARGIRVAASAEALPARSADVVVEATGSPEGIAQARRILRPRGVVILKSTYAGRVELDLSAFVVDELTIAGSRCGSFPPALALLASGALDPRDLIEARHPLSEGIAAFDTAARPGALKVLLRVSPSAPPSAGG